MKAREFKIRAQMAAKVMSSGNLVVVTDEDALLRLAVGTVDDAMYFAQARSALIKFRGNITKTVKGMDEILDDSVRAARESRATPKRKGKKIEVKEG